jgi:hypothetical protein
MQDERYLGRDDLQNHGVLMLKLNERKPEWALIEMKGAFLLTYLLGISYLKRRWESRKASFAIHPGDFKYNVMQ